MNINTNKKYELVACQSVDHCGQTFSYRVKATKDFLGIHKGDLGGYVHSEDNLSQEDNCWVDETSYLADNCEVTDNAQILNGSLIAGDAHISGEAMVRNSQVTGTASVWNRVVVVDSILRDNARVEQFARVFDSDLWDNSKVWANSTLHHVSLWADASVGIHDEESRLVHAVVRGGFIRNTDDVIVLGPLCDRNMFATYHVTSDSLILEWSIGKTYTLQEFEEHILEVEAALKSASTEVTACVDYMFEKASRTRKPYQWILASIKLALGR